MTNIEYPYKWEDVGGDQIRVHRDRSLSTVRNGAPQTTRLPTDREEQDKLIAAIVGEPVTVIRDSELPEVESAGEYVSINGFVYSVRPEGRHRENALMDLALARYAQRQQAEQDAKNAEREANAQRGVLALVRAGYSGIEARRVALGLIDQGVEFPEPFDD